MTLKNRLLPAHAAALGALALAGCNMAPTYRVPTSAPTTAQYKAQPGWNTATPADDVAKGEWWKLFGDPALDALEARVVVTNQNVAYYRAAYAQARAVVSQDRAALFPTVSASADVTRTGTFTSSSSGTTTGSGGSVSRTGTTLSATGSASWTPDLWGKLGNTVRQAKAQAQASAADLANATLSAQADLATNYLSLRALDAQAAMLDTTIEAYRRSLVITQNKLQAGTVSQADVDTAQTSLSNALASRKDLERQRATYENAVAVLVGENPSRFTLAPAAWAPVVPDVPTTIPSQILQRRPDIASAERAVAAANANIGVQRAAFFPDLTLTGSVGSSASSLGQLFSVASNVWSLGGSAALTVLDFGARSAKVRQARAAYDAAVATYRQDALTAFQEVENDLSAAAAYRAEKGHYATASTSADRAEGIARNQYLAGTVDYTTVTTAQATAYTARVNLIQNTLSQQTTAVSLIQAIGGHWQGPGISGLLPATK
ncbi:MAG TPA: efflux transporter outer membrane subunit [Novosphingobium sp.]|nr:efflux transporter outer membrane subunit [Novosphingobium sp.]